MPVPTNDTLFEGSHRGTVSPADPNLFSLADMAAAMGTDSLAVSTATSKVISTAAASALDSAPVSTASSKASSAAAQASVADSKAVSGSVNTSVADSKTLSVSLNTSIADSKAVSLAAVIIPASSYSRFDIQRYGASPTASAGTNRTAIQSALDTVHALGGGTITASIPGFYQIDDTLTWPSGVNADFGWGAAIDGATEYYGVWFQWWGTTGKTMISFLGKEYVRIAGMGLDGRSIAQSNMLIDSVNAPTAHDFIFERCNFWNAGRWLEWGTSGLTGYESDQVNFRNCKFYNPSVVGCLVNSVNTSQTSIFDNCMFVCPTANAVNMFQYLVAPYQVEYRRCQFAGPTGWTGTCFSLETGTTSGGQNLILHNNGFELGGTGYAFKVPAGSDERNGGLISWEDNSFSGAKIQVDGDRYISSKRNQYLTTNPTFTSGSRILSEQDVLTTGAWTLSGGAQVITLDRLTLAMVLKSLTVTDFASTGTLVVPRASASTGPFTLDIANGAVSDGVALANAATFDIANFSGLVTINETTSTGAVGSFVAGGGTVVAAGTTSSGFAVTSTAGKIGVFYSSGSTLRIENRTGGAITVAVMLFRTRAA